MFTTVLLKIDDTEKKPFVEKRKAKTKEIVPIVINYKLKLNEETEEELYDIVGANDKVINEEPLSKEDAEATIEALK